MAEGSTAGTYGENFGEGFQWHLLAVAARHPSGIIRFRSAFDHTYFSSDAQRVVAKALLTHVDKYKLLPGKSLLGEDAKALAGKEMAGKLEKQIEGMFTEDVSDAIAVLDKAVEFGKLQAMCNTVLSCADDLDKGDRSSVLSKVQTAMHVGDDILDLGINFGTADRFKWYGDGVGVEDYVPTGLSHVDRLLGGGGLRGGLYCILAPPGRGKTTALINIGFGPLLMPDEYNVVHITNEMSAKRTAMRYDARLAGKFYTLRKSDPEKYAEIMQDRAAKFLKGKLFIKGWPTRTCAVSNIRSYISMLLSGNGISHVDRIVVDYADIMRPERRMGEMRHEQAGIYEDLRQLAGEFYADCWTASQTSKGALDKETPDMSDFAETFEKAAVVDGALALCQTPDESIEGRGRFFAIKLRDAEDRSTVEFKIDRRKCFIQSTGLFDQALMRVVTPEDDPELEDVEAKPISKPKEAKSKSGGFNKKSAIKKYVPPATPTPIVAPALAAPLPPPKTAVKKPVLAVLIQKIAVKKAATQKVAVKKEYTHAAY